MVGWIILGIVALFIAAAIVGAIVYKNNKDKISKATGTVKTVITDIKK